METTNIQRRAARLSVGAVLSFGLLAWACGAEPLLRQSFAMSPDGGQTGPSTSPFGDAGATAFAGTSGAAGTTGFAGSTAQAGTTGSTGGTTGAGPAGATGIVDSGAPPDAAVERPSGAAGTSGAAESSGAAGAPACQGCKISVNYTCLSDASDQASFALDVSNDGASVILLADLKLRYWYTADAGKAQQLDCDDARLGCGRLASKFVPVSPTRTGANEYVELGFPDGAVAAMTSTGRIQVRLRNADYSQINQTDDYSQDCGNKAAHPNPKITAYLKGALVGGVEP